jgi:hypothetical protein
MHVCMYVCVHCSVRSMRSVRGGSVIYVCIAKQSSNNKHVPPCMCLGGSMRSMRSMRGGFIFRNRGPSLKVHHGQHLAVIYGIHVCPNIEYVTGRIDGNQ